MSVNLNTVTILRSEYALLKERQDNAFYLKRTIEEQKKEYVDMLMIAKSKIETEKRRGSAFLYAIYGMWFGILLHLILSHCK